MKSLVVLFILIRSLTAGAASTAVSLMGTASSFVNPAYITPGDTAKVVSWNGVQTTCSAWSSNICDSPKIMITGSASFAADLYSFHKNVWIVSGNLRDFCYYASQGTDIGTPVDQGESTTWSSDVSIISTGFGGTRPSTTNGPFSQDLGSYIRYWSVIDIGVMNPPAHHEYPGPYTSNFGYAMSLSNGTQFKPRRVKCAYW